MQYTKEELLGILKNRLNIPQNKKCILESGSLLIDKKAA